MEHHSYCSVPFPGQYEHAHIRSLSEDRMLSPTRRTPVKRKYREVFDDDTVADDGYFSGYPSPSFRNVSLPSYSFDKDVAGLPVCEREREYCARTRDESLQCGQHPPRCGSSVLGCDTVHGCDYHTFGEPVMQRLRHLHERTPQKLTPCAQRRRSTEVKRREPYSNTFLNRPSTCSKSPKQQFKCWTEVNCCCGDRPSTGRAARNLMCSLDNLDTATCKTAGNCAYPVKMHVGNRRPCSSPVLTSTRTCTQDSARDARPLPMEMSSDMCRCADLRHRFLRLAKSAFCNLRRKDTTPESFRQFSIEVNRTNEFLKQTLEMLKQIKQVCNN